MLFVLRGKIVLVIVGKFYLDEVFEFFLWLAWLSDIFDGLCKLLCYLINDLTIF
jgi:hypothetical protein